MAGRNVSFIKPQTPSFIAKFKEKVGYQESPSVDTKFQETEASSTDEGALEDEKPTVILGSNVSESEADAFLTHLNEEENARAEEEETRDAGKGATAELGKVVFKKPTKRKSSETGLDVKSGKGEEKKKTKTTSSMKKVKNKSLLSFDDEEDDAE